MEEARAAEKKKLNELKNTLYDQQRKMQAIQSEVEQISAKNSVLEQDFENEINKKNQNSKEVGQIVNSINNILDICKAQQAKRGRKLDRQGDDKSKDEEARNRVEHLITKLERASRTVEELVRVYREYGTDYTREKAYTEEIDAMKEEQAQAQAAAQAQKAAAGNRQANPVQASTFGAGQESTGMKTGKLTNY